MAEKAPGVDSGLSMKIRGQQDKKGVRDEDELRAGDGECGATLVPMGNTSTWESGDQGFQSLLPAVPVYYTGLDLMSTTGDVRQKEDQRNAFTMLHRPVPAWTAAQAT